MKFKRVGGFVIEKKAVYEEWVTVKPVEEKVEYFIKYEVEGFPCPFTAGPYKQTEFASHEFDIRGYEGVKNVEVYTKDKNDSKVPKVQ